MVARLPSHTSLGSKSDTCGVASASPVLRDCFERGSCHPGTRPPAPLSRGQMRRLLAALALATLAACDSFDPLTDNTVTGTWRGQSAGQSFVVVMQQAGATVAGSGTLTSTVAGARTISVSGTFNQP